MIIAGEPEASMLYQVLMLTRDSTSGPDLATPHKLPYKERKLIYDWIKEGAYWPDGAKLVAE